MYMHVHVWELTLDGVPHNWKQRTHLASERRIYLEFLVVI